MQQMERLTERAFATFQILVAAACVAAVCADKPQKRVPKQLQGRPQLHRRPNLRQAKPPPRHQRRPPLAVAPPARPVRARALRGAPRLVALPLPVLRLSPQPRSIIAPVLPRAAPANAVPSAETLAAVAAARRPGIAASRKYDLPPYVPPSAAELAAANAVEAARSARALAAAQQRNSAAARVSRGPRKGFGSFLGNVAKRPQLRRRPGRRPHPVHLAQRQQQAGRRQFQKTLPAGAPKFFYSRAEDMPGYQKFTLEEVVFPDKVSLKFVTANPIV